MSLATDRIDVEAVKQAAAGRWLEILPAIGGVPPELLDGRHHACPKCNDGVDRFRVFGDFAKTGGVFCNHCFTEKNGDGLAALQWLTDNPFPVVVQTLAEYLGVSRNGNCRHGAPADPIELVARSKRITATGLRKFGATVDGAKVVVPMYGPDGQPCSTSTLKPDGGKGFYAKGKSVGLFLPGGRLPQPGEHWIVGEGFKDAAALTDLDYLAAGLPGSSLAAKFAPMFRGVIVTIIPDRDTAGEKGAKKSAAVLRGLAASVKIAVLPAEFTDTDGADVRDVIAKQGADAVKMAIGNAVEAGPSTSEGGQITNAVIEGEGKDATTVPLPMSEVITRIAEASKGWPCRVDSALFVDDEKHGISWLEKAAALFGWLSRKVGAIYWHRVSGCVSKDETFAELRRTARRYEAIEEMPHEPRVDNHYYACQFPEPGNGDTLAKYLDFFSLETDLDRQLLTACTATPLWGGPAGSRPALLFTALSGRGKGKSSLAQFTGQIFGGHVDVSANEDIGKIKTRLLTAETAAIRIALLDNVKTLRLSWAELEALITSVVISGHRMYVGNGTRPNMLTWIITLNGASLSTDMSQRVVEVRLADPEYDGGWEERVSGFIEANRTAIIADLIGFLRQPAKPIQLHTRWASWESAVLSRVDDPDGCLDLIVQRRGQADVEEEESDIITSHFASKLAWLEYDADRDDVFLPNDIVAKWFNQATGDHKKTAGVTRTLKQLRDEKRLWRLSPYRMGGSGERGFRWTGERADVSAAIAVDIRQRIARKSKERQDSEDW
ncbi:MAG: hypothetical protein HQ581_02555 [Planctomycetes bacterium]|nr:hypothetical protein [Planctomycetota bacterium]